MIKATKSFTKVFSPQTKHDLRTRLHQVDGWPGGDTDADAWIFSSGLLYQALHVSCFVFYSTLFRLRLLAFLAIFRGARWSPLQQAVGVTRFQSVWRTSRTSQRKLDRLNFWLFLGSHEKSNSNVRQRPSIILFPES